MAGRYAQRSAVSPERSRAAIERVLRRYGADGFAYAWQAGRATVGFQMSGRAIRISVPLPTLDDVGRTPTGRPRTGQAARRALEQAERQCWRALELVIRAKLEAVEAGITTLEDEFLAHTLLADGRTVGEWARPQIEAPAGGRELPPLLGPGA